MAQFLEVMMMVCFGISWPINAMKAWKSRTARGKSIWFEVIVFVGYIFGISGKIMGGNVNYVVVVYVLNLVMVGIALALTLRNKMLDKIEDKKREKALAELTKAAQKSEENKVPEEKKEKAKV